MCAYVISLGQYVVAKTWRNWYLHDINYMIFVGKNPSKVWNYLREEWMLINAFSWRGGQGGDLVYPVPTSGMPVACSFLSTTVIQAHHDKPTRYFPFDATRYFGSLVLRGAYNCTRAAPQNPSRRRLSPLKPQPPLPPSHSPPPAVSSHLISSPPPSGKAHLFPWSLSGSGRDPPFYCSRLIVGCCY
jgi:hypothetical protein